MDWNKLKFTKGENDLTEFLFRHPTTSFNGKELAQRLRLSQTAIAKIARNLARIGIVKLEKKILLSINLNREDEDIFALKRIHNLRSIYSTGLIKELSDKFPGTTIILFGSYSYGEDTEDSDIDLAIIGMKERSINLEAFEEILERRISLNFYDSFAKIDNPLKNNIINGISLKGAIKI